MRDVSFRCLYMSTSSAEVMTRTCEKGSMNRWMNRWMRSCRDVDRVDKWAEDECCPPSHSENSCPSNPVRWQSNLFKETGSTFHPKGRLNLVRLCRGSLGCAACYIADNGLWTDAGYAANAIDDYCSIATACWFQLLEIVRSWFYDTTPHTHTQRRTHTVFQKHHAHNVVLPISPLSHTIPNMEKGWNLKPNLLLLSSQFPILLTPLLHTHSLFNISSISRCSVVAVSLCWREACMCILTWGALWFPLCQHALCCGLL